MASQRRPRSRRSQRAREWSSRTAAHRQQASLRVSSQRFAAANTSSVICIQLMWSGVVIFSRHVGWIARVVPVAGSAAKSAKKGVRMFPNGLKIENVAMGQPDGKLAKAGKRVRPS